MTIDAAKASTVLLTDAERQQVFRTCLDVLAQPGTIGRLSNDRHPAPLLPMLALTDLMSPIAALGSLEDDLRAIATVTRAPITELGRARWVLAGPEVDPAEFAGVPVGTPEEPQLGAMVCLEVAIGTGRELELSGPGIKGVRRVAIDLPHELITTRATLNSAYPCGIDLLCVSPTGDLLGIPRTTEITEVTR